MRIVKFCFRTPLKYSGKYAIMYLTSVSDSSGCSVYVPCAHKYQEMLRPQLSKSAGAFLCLAGKTLYGFYYNFAGIIIPL